MLVFVFTRAFFCIVANLSYEDFIDNESRVGHLPFVILLKVPSFFFYLYLFCGCGGIGKVSLEA